jgi:hypothetical protein
MCSISVPKQLSRTRAQARPSAARRTCLAARTFLSAACPEHEQGSDLLPGSTSHVAADKNVRAPR